MTHGGHSGPPQSTSVSSPFVIPSPHVAGVGDCVGDSVGDSVGDAVGDAVGDLRYTLATISRTIDGITNNLEASSRNFAEFSRLIRQNPGLLIGGSPQEDEALANTP